MSGQNTSTQALVLYPNTGVPPNSISAGLGITVVAGWWYYSGTPGSSDYLWSFDGNTSLRTSTTVTELTLELNEVTTDQQFATTDASLAANTWNFVAAMIGRTSTVTEQGMVWVGNASTLRQCTTISTVAGSGSIVASDNIVLMNNTLGGIANLVGYVSQFWHVSMPNAVAIDATALLNIVYGRFVQPMWAGTFDPFAVSTTTGETNLYSDATVITYAPLSSSVPDPANSNRNTFPYYQFSKTTQSPVTLMSWTASAYTPLSYSSEEPPGRRPLAIPSSPRLNPTFARV